MPAFPPPSQIASLAALACVLALGAAAAAQTTVREVVVEGREVVHETVGRTSTGLTEEIVSVSHRVRFSDLDLTKSADAATLRERVRHAAMQGCEQLQKLYPLATHDPDCVKQAVARAMPRVRAAMALH